MQNQTNTGLNTKGNIGLFVSSVFSSGENGNSNITGDKI